MLNYDLLCLAALSNLYYQRNRFVEPVERD
jgi:hypothetical protein